MVARFGIHCQGRTDTMDWGLVVKDGTESFKDYS